jgi:predicted ArsR family transcriptional regulator
MSDHPLDWALGSKAETRERRQRVLDAYSGQSTAELAAQLGISQQTIRSDMYWLRLGRYSVPRRP